MPARLKVQSLEGFSDYVEARLQRLGCWRDGIIGQRVLLQWLNTRPLIERRALAKEVGIEGALILTAATHHSQVGLASGWVKRYMVGPAQPSRATEDDRIALFRTAGAYWELINAIVDARVGLRGFEHSGTLIRLPYQGNRLVDALDRELELIEGTDTLKHAPRDFPGQRLRSWVRREGITQPWGLAPQWVKVAFRDHATQLVSTYPRYVDPDQSVAGLTGREIDTFWIELLAWGLYMEGAVLSGSTDWQVTNPVIACTDLIAVLASETGLDLPVVDQLVRLLTLDLARCNDGALTPFIPIDEGNLVPMSSLIVPSVPQRNLLAVLQSDHAVFGPVGEMLGRVGEKTLLSLFRQRLGPATQVASRVKVLRPDGTRAGDLDVVACDPSEHTIAVFEVKWGIAADGNAAVYKAETDALEKRPKVVALREQIRTGLASPRWPAGWPETTGFDVRSFVISRDVLVTRNIDDDDVTLRSYQLLSRTLRPNATFRDLMSVLVSPPSPPAERLRTEWKRVRYGDLRVDIEGLVG